MGDNDSLLKNLTRLIPGYGSYQDMESRREDDRLTREFLGSRLHDCKKKLDSIGEAAVSAGDLDAPMKIGKIRDRVDLGQSRLKAALEGYAGWFSEKKVDESLLKSVAELDANLVSLVDQMDAILGDGKSLEGVNLSELDEAIDQLHKRIDRRNEILKAGS